MELYRENVIVCTDNYAFNDGKPANLYLTRYYDNSLALAIEETEIGMFQYPTLSINLPNDTPADGCVFIKDYSEHQGLVENLMLNGIVKIIRTVTIGFRSGYEVELLGDIPTVPEVSIGEWR